MAIPTLSMNRLWNGLSPRPTSTVVGSRAEQSALKFLRRNGLRLIRRNYRCRFGELDLIMRDDQCLVVVEVRYRVSAGFATPALTVDERKQRKIARATLAYQASTARFREWPVRFDVIAILHTEAGPGTIQWIQDAFRV